MKKLLSQTSLIAGALLFAAALQVGAFIEPVSSPPSGNISAPINTGAVTQIKSGWVGATAFASTDGALFATGLDAKVGVGTTNPIGTLDVEDTRGGGAAKICLNGACVTQLTGSGTTLPGNTRYALLTSTAIASYQTHGVRSGAGCCNVGSNPDSINNYVFVPTNNVMTAGKKYAYLLLTSGDQEKVGGRVLANGTPITSRCYNNAEDPGVNSFTFSNLDGTQLGFSKVSRQGTFTYSPATITAADGTTAQGVLIARNTLGSAGCTDPGKGGARIYVYETSTLKAVMDQIYNETPVSEDINGQIYYYSPKNSSYLYQDRL